MVVVAACGFGLEGADAQPTRTQSIVVKREIGGQTVQSERDEQEALFNYYFRDRKLKYKTELANLKSEATVPAWRIPYSAEIHPESRGGLSNIAAAPRRGARGRNSQNSRAYRQTPSDAF